MGRYEKRIARKRRKAKPVYDEEKPSIPEHLLRNLRDFVWNSKFALFKEYDPDLTVIDQQIDRPDNLRNVLWQKGVLLPRSLNLIRSYGQYLFPVQDRILSIYRPFTKLYFRVWPLKSRFRGIEIPIVFPIQKIKLQPVAEYEWELIPGESLLYNLTVIEPGFTVIVRGAETMLAQPVYCYPSTERKFKLGETPYWLGQEYWIQVGPGITTAEVKGKGEELRILLCPDEKIRLADPLAFETDIRKAYVVE